MSVMPKPLSHERRAAIPDWVETLFLAVAAKGNYHVAITYQASASSKESSGLRPRCRLVRLAVSQTSNFGF